jgi:glycosyltransferase involved in cell wall biosynthesis
LGGTPRKYLLDVSRLIWRGWRRSLPTGIDRVCLEYVAHFRARSLAVVQRSGSTFVLSAEHSDRLFDLILNAPATKRSAFVAFGSTAWTKARRRPPAPGMTFLNVGHTGLDDPALPNWVAQNDLKAVYLIHDMIPLTHPEYCRAGEAAKHARRIEHALQSASGIIGNSDATLQEIEAFARRRDLAMPPSTVAWISGPRPPTEVHAKALDRPYFVTLGTIEGRKNHLMLLQMWQRLVAEQGEAAPKLVLIGQRGWEAEAALALLDRAPDLRGAVFELNGCSDAETASWLAGARALLMPSFAEGFGLPVIEALQLGTPVIASDLPVYREIVGELPTYLDPLDGPAWQRAVVSFAGDEDPERGRQLAALKGFQAPGWPEHFAKVEAWLQSL